ncbi:PREDICTED: cytochrome P450 26A1 [Chaetura pelagica]|uniref:cytochrome P450 26A1 n=1 Tax=Chaetura pelagica TaxID=8897 RepID=UPI000523EDD1|nr:PREDICTED: cytochrome P450 26A1 [Chaetura pelagica]
MPRAPRPAPIGPCGDALGASPYPEGCALPGARKYRRGGQSCSGKASQEDGGSRSALVASALCTVLLPLLVFLAAVKLWDLYCVSGRDPSCPLPLPPGTMGLPFFGETLQMVLQRRKFLQMKRRKYGFLFKTPPLVIMRAFSRDALQHYVPVIQEEVSSCLARWLGAARPCLLVYPEVKRLMFRIAMRILLGFQPRQASPDGEQQLVEAFEEMIRNLFSLPIDVPFSGLYRGLRARNIIHAKIEENIRAKMACKEPEGGYKDALQLLMEHTQSNGEQLNMQELKESATELLFGGHETTASAATSLVAFLGLHHDVLQKVRKELQVKGLLCSSNQEKQLDMEVLEQLKYTGCVIKETLRLSPPVPGGFRIALKTLELNGYQIPKGWNVIYSICDTHDVADLFTDKDEFNPDRFMSPSPEDSSRFSFIPFGGGLRSCVGKEFAKVLLKIFTVELARSCDWQLLNGPPTMKTGPIVYPVDNLPTKFISFSGQI